MKDAKRGSLTMVGSGDPRVASLIRELVRHAAGGDATAALDEANAVVVEQEVDGYRYLLVRAARRAIGGAKVTLSPREQEIVRMVAKGYPNKIIADVLEISCWTVSTYLRRIFAKLGVASRAAMVARILGESLGGEAPPDSASAVPSARG